MHRRRLGVGWDNTPYYFDVFTVPCRIKPLILKNAATLTNSTELPPPPKAGAGNDIAPPAPAPAKDAPQIIWSENNNTIIDVDAHDRSA